MTGAMQLTIDETDRRRVTKQVHNEERVITPTMKRNELFRLK